MRGFDSFVQISERALSHFIATIGLGPHKVLLNIDLVLLWKPNVLSVCGIWVQDLALYDLESVKVLLSNPLYNSGAVAGQGVYHYDLDWKNRPEHFGFILASRFPALDIYVRD